MNNHTYIRVTLIDDRPRLEDTDRSLYFILQQQPTQKKNEPLELLLRLVSRFREPT